MDMCTHIRCMSNVIDEALQEVVHVSVGDQRPLYVHTDRVRPRPHSYVSAGAVLWRD